MERKYTLRGLTDQHVHFLQEYGKLKNDSTVISKAIIALIEESMRLEHKQPTAKKIDMSLPVGKKKRIQLSLNERDYNRLIEISSSVDSSPQLYIIRTLLNEMYSEKIRLLGNEIEQFKKSNYELHKIGVNLNQVARALNAGEKAELDINRLYKEVKKHIEKAKSILLENTKKY